MLVNKISAQEVLDSRGSQTLEACVVTDQRRIDHRMLDLDGLSTIGERVCHVAAGMMSIRLHSTVSF